MSIRIIRDPANPMGGHALLILQGAPAAVPETTLRIQRLEDDQILGTSGWAPIENRLGPFVLAPHDDGMAVSLGPDIVGVMEPFQRLQIDAVEAQVTGVVQWPENILPLRARRGVRGGIKAERPAVAEDTTPGLGGVRTHRPAEQPAKEPGPGAAISRGPKPTPGDDAPADTGMSAGETGASPEPVTQAPPPSDVTTNGSAPPETQEPPTKVETVEPAPTEPEKKHSALIPILAGAAVIAAGVVAFLLFGDQILDSSDEGRTLTDIVCDGASVREENANQRWDMAKFCLENGEQGQALRLIERLVAENHPQAQLQFARWLDPEEVGTSPLQAPNPATSIRLYVRAKAAGLGGIEPMIERLCKSFEGIQDLNITMVRRQHCEEE